MHQAGKARFGKRRKYEQENNFMSIKDTVKGNPGLKKFIHWMLVPSRQAKPRLWVQLLVNPFVHKRGWGSSIKYRTRIDVLPFNRFELGKYSVIEDFCTINNGVGDVIIGDNTLVGMSNVIIGPVSIGNNVIFAQNIVVSALNHEYRDINTPIYKQKVMVSPIIVEDDCWIAANAVITSGVTIGRHSVVAAGAVVTKNVPPFSVVAGSPAKVIKQYDAVTESWVKV
jgi:acetyltransferase-like isoleucine patch superfamily enzyme